MLPTRRRRKQVRFWQYKAKVIIPSLIGFITLTFIAIFCINNYTSNIKNSSTSREPLADREHQYIILNLQEHDFVHSQEAVRQPFNAVLKDTDNSGAVIAIPDSTKHTTFNQILSRLKTHWPNSNINIFLDKEEVDLDNAVGPDLYIVEVTDASPLFESDDAAFQRQNTTDIVMVSAQGDIDIRYEEYAACHEYEGKFRLNGIPLEFITALKEIAEYPTDAHPDAQKQLDTMFRIQMSPSKPMKQWVKNQAEHYVNKTMQEYFSSKLENSESPRGKPSFAIIVTVKGQYVTVVDDQGGETFIPAYRRIISDPPIFSIETDVLTKFPFKDYGC